MKKILMTLLVAASSVTVYAQLGVTAGLNIAKYTYNNGSQKKSLTSFNGGLVYRTALDKDFKWQPELTFSGKGAVSIPPATSGVAKYKNKLGYIEFASPFIYNTNFGGDDNLTFDVGVGPYAAYLISATNNAEKIDGTKTKRDFGIGSGTTDEIKAMDFGLTYVVGAIIQKNIGIHLKYDQGLRNLEPNYAVKWHTGNFALNLTYYFNK